MSRSAGLQFPQLGRGQVGWARYPGPSSEAAAAARRGSPPPRPRGWAADLPASAWPRAGPCGQPSSARSPFDSREKLLLLICGRLHAAFCPLCESAHSAITSGVCSRPCWVGHWRAVRPRWACVFSSLKWGITGLTLEELLIVRRVNMEGGLERG